MGVGPGLYMYDVVVKSSRSLSHLLMSFLFFFLAAGTYSRSFRGFFSVATTKCEYLFVSEPNDDITITSPSEYSGNGSCLSG